MPGLWKEGPKETVRIALMDTTLSDLHIKLGDILNGHVNVPIRLLQFLKHYMD